MGVIVLGGDVISMKIARKISGMAAALAIMVTGITGVTSTVGDVPEAEAAAKYYSYTLQPFHRQAINRGTLGIRYADKGKKGWRFANVAYRNRISTFGVCYIDTKKTGVSTVNRKLLLTTNAR